MCGLAGIFIRPEAADKPVGQIADAMAACLKHRGPDDHGGWDDPRHGVAFGFRRLAILDLSPSGHQPMVSASGRFTIAYNGEIYNYRDLRRELEAAGARFRGHSDTEVLLAAFERWGIVESLKRAAGMFGMAVWDAEARTLTLARDRLGIKPLFIARVRGGLAFASELKAFRPVPGFDPTPDPEAAVAFLRYLYVPDPRTIYRSVVRLPPGHYVTIRDPAAEWSSAPYWSLTEVAEAGLADPFRGTEAEAEELLATLLTQVVGEHLASDVPLGAFLSGGIDSSTVTAIMQAQRSDPVRTFCIAFDDPAHNEAAHAARVAHHLGTQHQEIMVTGREALELVPRIPDMFDEPFADTSQIPAALLCQLARSQVTVALSGEGGDEIFGGYNRYTYAAGVFRQLNRIPRPLRPLAAGILSGPPPALWNGLAGALAPVLPSRMRFRLPAEKIAKTGSLLAVEGDGARYRSLVSAWQQPAPLIHGARSSGWDPLGSILGAPSPAAMMDRFLLADQLTYLPGDQLTKADRVSMAASLELRVPLLDHRVVELSWRLPLEYKIHPGRGKEILRRVLYRYVPKELIERPKVGFTVPLVRWLKGPLKEWADDLLQPEAVARGGLLQTEPVTRAWERFQRGRTELGLGLWAVLMLRGWEDAQARVSA